ncbi:Pantothenate kinase 2 [Hibiscus syriacus]|uniref:Pantothenate kinase 2 n=1 Tax=Hibiscus syriacus TaxID=106335 RepID=A0A6A3CXY4_HIBSY|nr:Pantothenate kinase 2 [Hibiscus syriacus]
MEGEKISIDIPRNRKSKVLDPVISVFLVQLPHKLRNCLKVSVGKGSLCHLKATVDIGLPPDEVYNICTDPDNRRVFKNVKEVISRKVLIDEGQRQVVEVEQSAIWRFLWWSGTISVHVLVDQNRDHTMRFKQMSNGFMQKFEALKVTGESNHFSWTRKSVFFSNRKCCQSIVHVLEVKEDQLIQPAIAPPPPISWYLSGIPAKTTEMLINDLVAKADRIKGRCDSEILDKELWLSKKINEHHYQHEQVCDTKERWKSHRRNRKLLQRLKKLFTDESSSF